jgi:hypothetical protein
VDTLQRLRHALAAQAGKLLPHAQQLWHGLCPKLMDGTAVSLPDTPANQRAYPQSRSRQPGCGFPLLKLVGLFSLVTTLTDPKLYPAGELARLDALRTAGRQAPTQALSPARQTPPSVPGAPASQSLLEEQPPEIKGLI